MKSALLVVLLAVAASAAVIGNDVPEVADMNDDEMLKVVLTHVDELTDVAEVSQQSAVATRRTLNLGTIGSRDVLVYDERISANFAIDVNASGNRPITAIRVNPWGPSNNANPTLIRGGIGQTFATVRLTPPPGLGFVYTVQFYVSP